MSASRSPTFAPDRRSDAARLTATVDLPTPPLPEPTAMACFTPGITCSGERPPNAARTLAVILRSTAVTPGRPPTSSRAIDWKRSRTGHAGVVSSNTKLTRPESLTRRSLIMPRLTTSRPRSGSWIADSTASTWSVLGTWAWLPLLGTEDYGRPHGQHRQQDQDRDQRRLHRHRGHGRGSSACL